MAPNPLNPIIHSHPTARAARPGDLSGDGGHIGCLRSSELATVPLWSPGHSSAHSAAEHRGMTVVWRWEGG